MARNEIVIGDVHGCLDELNELIRAVNYDVSKDKLYFVGDLVDRGPSSVGVVKRVQQLKGYCVLGNHEEKFIRYKKHEQKREKDPSYKNPMRFNDDKLKTYLGLEDVDLDFLSKLPLIRHLDCGWTLVHAGFVPGIKAEYQFANTCLRARFLNEKTYQTVSLRYGDHSQPPGSVGWWNVWEGPERVVYGHNVHNLYYPLQKEYSLGIDTGCVFGGRLTAVVFNPSGSFDVVQVQAKQIYFEK